MTFFLFVWEHSPPEWLQEVVLFTLLQHVVSSLLLHALKVNFSSAEVYYCWGSEIIVVREFRKSLKSGSWKCVAELLGMDNCIKRRNVLLCGASLGNSHSCIVTMVFGLWRAQLGTVNYHCSAFICKMLYICQPNSVLIVWTHKAPCISSWRNRIVTKQF